MQEAALQAAAAGTNATAYHGSFGPPTPVQMAFWDSPRGEWPAYGFQATRPQGGLGICVRMSKTLRKWGSDDGNSLFHEGSQEHRGKGRGASRKAITIPQASADGVWGAAMEGEKGQHVD